MKIATFLYQGRSHAGVLDAGGTHVRPLWLGDQRPATQLLDVVDSHVASHNHSDIDIDLDELAARGGPAIPLDQVSLQAPIPRPRRNLFCVGKNYLEHIHELAGSGFDSSASSGAPGAVPGAPIVFSKLPDTVIGPGHTIQIDPRVSAAIDYEAELAIIIGRGGRQIPRARALDHVWGYTIVNDVTARDLQNRHKQWLIGKSQDTFCPMGPWAVTADEIDLANTEITCHVNGELRQHSNTRLMIFDVPTIIEFLSAGITLQPGDVIATGTPAGVGFGFEPPRYLTDGDIVYIEIQGIGVLQNPVSTARNRK